MSTTHQTPQTAAQRQKEPDMAKNQTEPAPTPPAKSEPAKAAPAPASERIENALRVLADSHARTLPSSQATDFIAKFEAAMMV